MIDRREIRTIDCQDSPRPRPRVHGEFTLCLFDVTPGRPQDVSCERRFPRETPDETARETSRRPVMTIRIPALRQTAHGAYPILTRLLGAAFLALALAAVPVLTAEASAAGAAPDVEGSWHGAMPGGLRALPTPDATYAGGTASAYIPGAAGSAQDLTRFGSQITTQMRKINVVTCSGGVCCYVYVDWRGNLIYYCW
jgi:hypothetical protein